MKTKFTLITLLFLFIFGVSSKSQIGVTYYQSSDSTRVPANKPIVINYPAEIADTSGETLDVIKLKKYILFESDGSSIAYSAFQTAPNEITIIPHDDMLANTNYNIEINPLKYKESGELTESFQYNFMVDRYTESQTVETAYLNTYSSLIQELSLTDFPIDSLKKLSSYFLPENLCYLKKDANQVERMKAVAPLFDIMVRFPGLRKDLFLQSVNSLGTIDDLGVLSAEAEAQRMISLGYLFASTARNPEIADTLELLADTLLGVPQDFALLSDEAKAARMQSLSLILEAIARQPAAFHTLLNQGLKYHGAIQLTGNSTQQAEEMRMVTLSYIFNAIARQPIALDSLVIAADTLLGVPSDFSNFDDQVIAARMQALSSIFESAARQPEMADTMLQQAVRYMGRITDLNPLDSISEAMRMYALSSLWESIARQPEASEIMCTMVDTLMGTPEDFSSLSNFGKEGRIIGLSSIFESMARQPEISDTLLSKAAKYCGTSDQIGILHEKALSYAMITYGMALNAFARRPEIWRKIDVAMDTLMGINENYESFSDMTHQGRAIAIESLFMSISRQPLYCDTLTILAEKFLGTAGQFTTIPDPSRFYTMGSLIQSMLRQFNYADTLDLAAERLIGVPDDFSTVSDEAIYMRYRVFSSLFQMNPSNPEVWNYILNILYKYIGKWEQINKESEFAQMARIDAFPSIINAVFSEPDNTNEYLNLFEDILGIDDFSNLTERVKLRRHQALVEFYSKYNLMIDSTASDSLHKVAKTILGTNTDCPVETWKEAEMRMESLARLFEVINYGSVFIKAESRTSEKSFFDELMPLNFQNDFDQNFFGETKPMKDKKAAFGYSINSETLEKFITVIEEFSGNANFNLGSNNKMDYFRQIADGYMTVWLKSNAIHDTLIADARHRILGMYTPEKPKLYGDPSHGAINVPIDYKMSLLFNDIMYTSNYTLLSQSNIQDSVKLLTIENEHVPFSLNINSNNRTITVVPSEELTYGMQYKLMLPACFINFDDSTANEISHQFKAEKALLKITAEDKEMKQGEQIPELTMIFDGFVDGDSTEAITKPQIATEATSVSSSGTYPITLTGGNSEKYTFQLNNGTLTILSTTNSGEIEDESGLKIYPNPVSDILYIDQHISECTIKRVEIINQIGQIVYTEQFDETKSSISVSELESGLYFLNIKMNDQSIITKKIVKK